MNLAYKKIEKNLSIDFPELIYHRNDISIDFYREKIETVKGFSLYFNLFDLENFFPFSEHMLISSQNEHANVVKTIDFYFEFLIKSIDAFHFEKAYHKFDAQVGDNLCQIRAIQLFDLERKMEFYEREDLLRKKHEIFKKKEKLLSLKYLGKHDRCSLSDFINKNEISVNITGSQLYLFICYFLSHFNLTNERGVSIGMDYKKMLVELCISKTQARKIVHLLQKLLSLFSVAFIFNISLNDSTCIPMYPLLVQLLKKDEESRFLFPCYLVSKVIWLSLLSYEGSHVLFFIERFEANSFKDKLFLLFTTNMGNKIEFVGEINDQFLPQENAFVIRGTVCYENNKFISKKDFLNMFKNSSLENIYFCNQAVHKQYSGKLLSEFQKNPYKDINQGKANNCFSDFLRELALLSNFRSIKKDTNLIYSVEYSLDLEVEWRFFKDIAFEKGCCRDRNTTFLITHMFFDAVGNLFHRENTFIQDYMGLS